MRVLAIDTTTSVGSVAVVDERGVLAELTTGGRERHGEVLSSEVDRALSRSGLSMAEVDLLAVDVGPGSFTGLRVGLSAVKGLALAGETPVVGVGSLEALAGALPAVDGVVVCVMDASKGEVFAAVYEAAVAGVGQPSVPAFHDRPDRVVERLANEIGGRRGVVVGNGFRRYQETLLALLPDSLLPASSVFDAPRASVVAAIATRRFRERGPDDLASLEPHYVRGSDARLPTR